MTDPEPVRVTRAQMLAARGRLITDARLGRTSPPWLYALAAADHDPDWQTGGAALARIARLPPVTDADSQASGAALARSARLRPSTGSRKWPGCRRRGHG